MDLEKIIALERIWHGIPQFWKGFLTGKDLELDSIGFDSGLEKAFHRFGNHFGFGMRFHFSLESNLDMVALSASFFIFLSSTLKIAFQGTRP